MGTLWVLSSLKKNLTKSATYLSKTENFFFFGVFLVPFLSINAILDVVKAYPLIVCYSQKLTEVVEKWICSCFIWDDFEIFEKKSDSSF